MCFKKKKKEKRQGCASEKDIMTDREQVHKERKMKELTAV